jgi:molecular chaperone GrpE
MTAEHDNASGEAVGPGDHPAAGPAAGAPSPGRGAPQSEGAQPQAPATPAGGNGDPGALSPDDPALRSADTATAGPAAAQAEPSPEDHERQLERDLEELSARAEKADEYLELARRTKADFENYRKRAAREAAAAQDRGIAKLAKELLPAVDNLDRAVQAAEAAAGNQAEPSNGATATLVSGIKLVHADVLAALQRAGIERYSPHGELFDPQRHEAIAQQPVDGAQPGTIVEVYQQGYLLGEVVIRPARVVVAG